MSQQIPSCPGLRACSPPVSAKGTCPHQERCWTVNTQPTGGCFTLQAQGSSGSWRTWTVHQDYLKNGSLPIHYQLPLLPEHAWATPATSLHPGTPRWLVNWRHGQDWQPKAMAATAAAETGPAVASPCGGERGVRRQVLSTGPETPPHGQQQCVPTAPTATNSKEKPSEGNFLMYLQFLLEAEKEKRRLYHLHLCAVLRFAGGLHFAQR